ncbi:MAG: leucine-rich repeat domain-containing protein, partial [Oscillospiraceae bacterium]|nr:leucine-rich repeat domain-containing protein [Oscillospiraceae bacterium]
GNYAFDECNIGTVYYRGSAEDWKKVSVGSNNGILNNVWNITFAEDSVTSVPDFILPAALTEIGEEAFAAGAFTFVKLSEQTTTIGTRAFADCSRLKYIYIPAITEIIDEHAFDGVEGLTILGTAGSKAEIYATEHGFDFVVFP